MITIGLLVWVGVQLNAPAWFYILLVLATMWQVVKFCVILFKD